MLSLPVIDLSRPLASIAVDIEKACTASGFFYVDNHGVHPEKLKGLDEAARRFFALPEPDKMEIAMARAGKAWRGFFPVGAELTSGRPDLKEGLYFGRESESDVDLPLHGRNLFPATVPELRPAVLSYMDAVEAVAHQLMRAVAMSLGLDPEYFHENYTANPTILFRIFHYPPSEPVDDSWGVGEHTDYGLLTLLAQDGNGGLQVRSPQGWIDAPPIPGTFVCNIGDMLDRLTGGYYRSTPHRVRNTSGNERLSFPFFFDPDFHREVPPLPDRARFAGDGASEAGAIRQPRWDGQDLRAFEGTYGDYLVAKVAKVFPELAAQQTEV